MVTDPKTKLRAYLPYISVSKDEVALFERGIENMTAEEAKKVVTDLETALSSVGPAFQVAERELRRHAEVKK